MWSVCGWLFGDLLCLISVMWNGDMVCGLAHFATDFIFGLVD